MADVVERGLEVGLSGGGSAAQQADFAEIAERGAELDVKVTSKVIL